MKFNFLEVHRIWTRVKGQHFRYWLGFRYISSLKYGSARMLITNLGTVLCYSLKIETSVLICLANLIIFWETLAMTKKWMRERWIARFVGYFNCSFVSYPILSEGSFSAEVPSSSSGELASFSCQKSIYFFLSDIIALNWKLNLLFIELYLTFMQNTVTLRALLSYETGNASNFLPSGL